jgi:hypothetical protein
MEVDTAFFGDPDGAKADVVDVNLGEFSEFHDEFGYYPQGVSVTTCVFPAGWRDRIVASRHREQSLAGGYAWNHTTASWPSSSALTRRTSGSRDLGLNQFSAVADIRHASGRLQFPR